MSMSAILIFVRLYSFSSARSICGYHVGIVYLSRRDGTKVGGKRRVGEDRVRNAEKGRKIREQGRDEGDISRLPRAGYRKCDSGPTRGPIKGSRAGSYLSSGSDPASYIVTLPGQSGECQRTGTYGRVVGSLKYRDLTVPTRPRSIPSEISFVTYRVARRWTRSRMSMSMIGKLIYQHCSSRELSCLLAAASDCVVICDCTLFEKTTDIEKRYLENNLKLSKRVVF